MKLFKQGIIGVITLVSAFIVQTFGQDAPQFTAVKVTDEGAIHLEWMSKSNHIYQVQCTDQLAGNDDGSTAWQILYDDYPSQGTNTFWLDTGNYILHTPPILHPKNMPMRFYRVMDKGADDLNPNDLAVSVIAPTNGFMAFGDLTVTVVTTTTNAGLITTLYVDGQAMRPSNDGSNFVINTCEWGNGPHVLFATVECLSHLDGPLALGSSTVGHAVSPFVQVTFSNLITRIAFSEPFFNPNLGQTQKVTAAFVANVDWTLQIVDQSSNAVRVVTGSGTSLQFDWDGTGEGETNIPDGVYYYQFSAQTNGNAFLLVDDISSYERFSFKDSADLWAIPSDGMGAPAPFALYPPGVDTNNLIFFEDSTRGSDLASEYVDTIVDDVSDNASSSSYSGPDAQNSSAPTRPPTAARRGSVGKYAIAFQSYNGNGTNGIQPAALLDNNSGLRTFVQIEGKSTSSQPITWYPLHESSWIASEFDDRMSTGGWDRGSIHPDDGLHLSDLQGSGTFFNEVDLGLLILHGAYGTSFDLTPGHPVKQMYFPIASGAAAQYLRMSDISFGGTSATNGLKWMAVLACNSLYHSDWTSMQSQNVKPYNNNLHLLLGGDTEFAQEPNLAQKWADLMLGNPSASQAQVKIRDAWYQAASFVFQQNTNDWPFYPTPVKFAVAGDTACFNDFLQTQTNTVLSGSWSIDSPQQVWP